MSDYGMVLNIRLCANENGMSNATVMEMRMIKLMFNFNAHVFECEGEKNIIRNLKCIRIRMKWINVTCRNT